MNKKYYILGVGYQSSDIGNKYPYEVWLDLQEEKYPFVLVEGQGASGVGGSFKPSELLQPHWAEHLAVTGTEWIVSLCEEALKNNDLLDVDLVLNTYEHINKRKPNLREI